MNVSLAKVVPMHREKTTDLPKSVELVDPEEVGTAAHSYAEKVPRLVGRDKDIKSLAKVAELVDAHDSNSCSFGSEGSIPSFGTKPFDKSEGFLICI